MCIGAHSSRKGQRDPGSACPLMPPTQTLSASGIQTAWWHSFQHRQSAGITIPSHRHHRSLLGRGFLCPCALRHCYKIRLQSQRGQVVKQSSPDRSQVHCAHHLLACWKSSELFLTDIRPYLQQPRLVPGPALLSLFWGLWPCLSWFFSSSQACQPNPFPKGRNVGRGP